MRAHTHLAIGVITVLETSLLTQMLITPTTFVIACICSLLPDIDEPKSNLLTNIINHPLVLTICRYSLYFINMISCIILIYVNKYLIFNFLISFILIIIIEINLKHILLRKFLLSLLLLILTYSLYLIHIKQSILIPLFILSLVPWIKNTKFTHSILAIITLYVFLFQLEHIFLIENLAIFSCISYASHIFLGDIFTKKGIEIFYPITRKKLSCCFIKSNRFTSNFLEYVYIFTCMAILFYTFNVKIHL